MGGGREERCRCGLSSWLLPGGSCPRVLTRLRAGDAGQPEEGSEAEEAAGLLLLRGPETRRQSTSSSSTTSLDTAILPASQSQARTSGLSTRAEPGCGRRKACQRAAWAGGPAGNRERSSQNLREPSVPTADRVGAEEVRGSSVRYPGDL